MFKLVGPTPFTIENGGRTHQCNIDIRPEKLSYNYRLTVDGKSHSDFTQRMRVLNKTWLVDVDGTQHSIVLGQITREDDGFSESKRKEMHPPLHRITKNNPKMKKK